MLPEHHCVSIEGSVSINVFVQREGINKISSLFYSPNYELHYGCFHKRTLETSEGNQSLLFILPNERDKQISLHRRKNLINIAELRFAEVRSQT